MKIINMLLVMVVVSMASYFVWGEDFLTNPIDTLLNILSGNFSAITFTGALTTIFGVAGATLVGVGLVRNSELYIYLGLGSGMITWMGLWRLALLRIAQINPFNETVFASGTWIEFTPLTGLIATFLMLSYVWAVLEWVRGRDA